MGMSLLVRRQLELQNCRDQLSVAEADVRQIRSDLDRIENLRNRLRTRRNSIRTHRTAVREFVTSDFPNWQGNIRSTQFQGAARDRLVDRDYQAALNGVQTTLDNLNSRRTVLENKLISGNGLVSSLNRRINILMTEIQNLINWN